MGSPIRGRDYQHSRKASGAASTSIKALGVSVGDLTSAQKDKIGINDGVVVTNVDKYSDAFMRGLAQGMVIVEANKRKISSADDLADAIKGKQPGDSVLLKVVTADGQERIVAVKLQ